MVETGSAAPLRTRIDHLATADVDGQFRDRLVDTTQNALLGIGAVVALGPGALRPDAEVAARPRRPGAGRARVPDHDLPRGTVPLRVARRDQRVHRIRDRRHLRPGGALRARRTAHEDDRRRSGARRHPRAAPARRDQRGAPRVQHAARVLGDRRDPHRRAREPDLRPGRSRGRAARRARGRAQSPVRSSNRVRSARRHVRGARRAVLRAELRRRARHGTRLRAASRGSCRAGS